MYRYALTTDCSRFEDCMCTILGRWFGWTFRSITNSHTCSLYSSNCLACKVILSSTIEHYSLKTNVEKMLEVVSKLCVCHSVVRVRFKYPWPNSSHFSTTFESTRGLEPTIRLWVVRKRFTRPRTKQNWTFRTLEKVRGLELTLSLHSFAYVWTMSC